MSKKDYELIARVLQETVLCGVPKLDRLRLADAFAFELQADNPRFDPARFRAATLPPVDDEYTNLRDDSQEPLP